MQRARRAASVRDMPKPRLLSAPLGSSRLLSAPLGCSQLLSARLGSISAPRLRPRRGVHLELRRRLVDEVDRLVTAVRALRGGRRSQLARRPQPSRDGLALSGRKRSEMYRSERAAAATSAASEIATPWWSSYLWRGFARGERVVHSLLKATPWRAARTCTHQDRLIRSFLPVGDASATQQVEVVARTAL